MPRTDAPSSSHCRTPVVLIACASRDTCTAVTATVVADELRRHGVGVDIAQVGDVVDLGGYGGLVVGGTPRGGRWPLTARRFLARNAGTLSERPVWLFECPPAGTAGVAGLRLTDAAGGPVALGHPTGGDLRGPLARFDDGTPAGVPAGTRRREWARRIAGSLGGRPPQRPEIRTFGPDRGNGSG